MTTKKTQYKARVEGNVIILEEVQIICTDIEEIHPAMIDQIKKELDHRLGKGISDVVTLEMIAAALIQSYPNTYREGSTVSGIVDHLSPIIKKNQQPPTF